MPVSPSGPVRRAQLIAPFGIGSLIVVPGGTSLIVGGLDYWFNHNDEKKNFDSQEFFCYEWRLQRVLHVTHFRLPPDFRENRWGDKIPNLGLTVPTFRFPVWHFCPDKDCRLLYDWPMYTKGVRGRIKCPECAQKRKTRYMFQVPFVAMCAHGHLQDFPWREWVHREIKPTCSEEKLRLISTGTATLAGLKVKCDCGKERTLAGITIGYPDGSTILSKTLDENSEFLCQGHKPWLGPGREEYCNAPLRGSLRSASNLYYAHVLSSIYLPRAEDEDLLKIEYLLQTQPLGGMLNILLDAGQRQPVAIVKALRQQYARLLTEFTDNQVIQVVTQMLEEKSAENEEVESDPLVEESHTSFRRAEYIALKTERNDEMLKIKRWNTSLYDHRIVKFFSRVMLVSKLRETRVFTGFSRIWPDSEVDYIQRQSMLWKKLPDDNDRWLPAYIVNGEGIFIEFDENRVAEWENRRDVIKRVKPLVDRYSSLKAGKHGQGRSLGPRFILIHTFAHLLMNRLTFECGYSSAALRERLYVSADNNTPMCGVLIYTADGDSEGTMGGLVRMGKPGYIEPVIRRALESARWCSADPVCMEMGHSKGQGPDSCNLAACHNCALVPETACEEFNRFLDRGVIVGDVLHPEIGFFNH